MRGLRTCQVSGCTNEAPYLIKVYIGDPAIHNKDDVGMERVFVCDFHKQLVDTSSEPVELPIDFGDRIWILELQPDPDEL